MRNSTSAGQPASAASGAGADQLGAGDRRARPHGVQHGGRRHGAMVLDVRRDLDDVLSFQPQPEGADAGQSRVADRGRDRPRVGERRGRRERDVEGDQRRPRGDERRTGGGVQLRRAVVRRRPALRQPGGSALAQLGARAPVRELAVEEHGDPGPADRVGGQQRLGDRRAALRLLEEHDRRDVERADARVQAVVPRAGRSALPPRRHRPRARGAAAPAPPRGRRPRGGGRRPRSGAGPRRASRTRPRSRRARRLSRPSETLGTATSRVMPRARSARRRARGCRRRRASRPRPARRGGPARRPCRRCPRSRRTRRAPCRASSRPRGSAR